MTTAKLETIEVPVTTITKKGVVTLQTSPEMAQFLYDVTGMIGGDPSTTRRRFSDELRAELKKLPCVTREYIDKCGDTIHKAPDISNLSGINFNKI